MEEKCIIIIFTKDRTESLQKTLFSIEPLKYSKYIIDDSVKSENRLAVSELSLKSENCNYFGESECREFLDEHVSDDLHFLVRGLGFEDWNLGYARNFALLLSTHLKADKVLFMDDDIQIQDLQLVDDLFELLDKFLFAGANIAGLIDDSIIGHIATDVGIFNERMLSGGFLMFKPECIDHYFLNIYNEDWIWLFLHLRDKEYIQHGYVYQEYADPLVRFERIIVFQEFGEIALDGILELYKRESHLGLTDVRFWEQMLYERDEYLQELHKRADQLNKNEYVKIIKSVYKSFPEFPPLIFADLFTDYFNNREKFLDFYRGQN